MGVERRGIEPAGGDRLDGLAHARHVDRRVALVRVDHVDARQFQSCMFTWRGPS